MSEYLTTLTVKALREIAKRIGFRFISRYRKAELINLIMAEIDACHTEAIREDNIRTNADDVKELARLRQTMRDMGIARFGFMTVKDMRTMIASEIEILHAEALSMNEDFDSIPRKTYEDVHNASVKLMEMEGKNYAALSPDARCVLSERVRRIWNGSDSEKMRTNAIALITEGIEFFTPRVENAYRAFKGAITEQDKDVTYQAYQDMSNALDTMTRTLAWVMEQ